MKANTTAPGNTITQTVIENQLEWKSVCDSTAKKALCRAFKSADLKKN